MKPAKKNNASKAEKDGFPGHPQYPSSEDIYNNAKEEADIDPETRLEKSSEPPARSHQRTIAKDHSGDDLDVPGAELDDQQESVGSEDEENNFYSLGGDAHENQEEDKTP